jgi:hypothetical protein
MALFTRTQLKTRVNIQRQRDYSFAQKSARQVIEESRKSFPPRSSFDIFLSHSTDDTDMVVGMMLILKDLGYSVYVDWVVDSQLDRSNVTKENADQLRKRMDDSKSLLFTSTDNASTSKWMPWETGYFDAKKGKVAIAPISNLNQPNDRYEGREYLGLYPYVSIGQSLQTYQPILLIHESETSFLPFSQWVRG